jgi:magnesium chelatase subunit D
MADVGHALLADDDAATTADVALALLACAPSSLGGALVIGGSLECERWLAALRVTRGDAPWKRVPVGVSDDRLVGGLDVAATLARGSRVVARGLLAEADGGTVVLPRVADASAAVLGAVARALDEGTVRLERDGMSAIDPARVCVIAVADEQERDTVPTALADRLALHVTLPAGYEPGAAPDGNVGEAFARCAMDAASARLLVQVADALGVASPRALVLAGRAARAGAAADGRARVTEDDLARAVRLVLAPRATRVPDDAADQERQSPAPVPEPDGAPADTASERPDEPDAAPRAGDLSSAELLIDAARAAIPADLLAGGIAPRGAAPRAGSGRRGPEQRDETRGRRVGTRQGHPRRGARLDLVETLRAAAPWQAVRARERTVPRQGVDVRGDDLRVQRRMRRVGTTTVFVVDASGSAALGRLAEAKGAVELLLAESYVRRDRVAVIAFRGPRAELLLPPTRALTRARRALAGLPAGGGTPLASALAAACQCVDQVRREGGRTAVVLLTDGRANVALDGTPGRAQARLDAHAAARALAARSSLVVMVDTSPRGDPEARALAAVLDGRYVALPVVTARALHARVRAIVDAEPATGPTGRRA